RGAEASRWASSARAASRPAMPIPRSRVARILVAARTAATPRSRSRRARSIPASRARESRWATAAQTARARRCRQALGAAGTAAASAVRLRSDHADVVERHAVTVVAIGDHEARAVGRYVEALDTVELRHRGIVVIGIARVAVTGDRRDHAVRDHADVVV